MCQSRGEVLLLRLFVAFLSPSCWIIDFMLCYIVNIPLLHKLRGREESSFSICQLSERGFCSICCHLGLCIHLSTDHGNSCVSAGIFPLSLGHIIFFRDCWEYVSMICCLSIHLKFLASWHICIMVVAVGCFPIFWDVVTPSCSTVKQSKKNTSIEVEDTLILWNVRSNLDFYKVLCICYANRGHPNPILLTCLKLVIMWWTHQVVRTHVSASYFIVRKWHCNKFSKNVHSLWS